MVHRAPFGSLERFMGILIEHYEGAFPFWLAPTQIVIATISEKTEGYAKEVFGLLDGLGIRAELDVSPEKIGPKKHRARKMKVPYIVVLGEQEANSRTVNLNDREGRQMDSVNLQTLAELLTQENRPGGRCKVPEAAEPQP